MKDTERVLFHYKNVKKGTPNLTSPYVHSFFTIVFMTQIFLKNKSLRAASGSSAVEASPSAGKNTGIDLVPSRAWKRVSTAISGGMDIS